MKVLTRITVTLALSPALLPGFGWAQAGAPSSEEQDVGRLVRQSYPDIDGQERDYYVYLPAAYDTDRARRWPVLLFLHGDGERGDGKEDLDWVLTHGPLYEAWVQKRDMPFIILAPQLPLYGREKTVDYIRDRDPSQIPRRLETGVPPRPGEHPTPGPMTGATSDENLPFGIEGPADGWYRREEDLLVILAQAMTTYRVDPRRIYLTGLSYGGFGTWYLASRHPKRFAAIAPVVGWGHPDLMAPLAEHQVPVWAFAGGRDPGVRVKHFYPGLNELEKRGHTDVRFTVHEDRSHDAWRRVYAGHDLYVWLLSHSLGD